MFQRLTIANELKAIQELLKTASGRDHQELIAAEQTLQWVLGVDSKLPVEAALERATEPGPDEIVPAIATTASS